MNFGDDIMWLIVMFDLPTNSKQARKDYTIFRKQLLCSGYNMMQYSVYIRHCATDENANAHASRVKKMLPPSGEVRIIKITDLQFGNIDVFFGPQRKENVKPAQQLTFF